MRAIAERLSAEWRALDFSALQFWQRDTAQVVLIALVAAAALVLLVRVAMRRRPGRHYVVLPAILGGTRRRSLGEGGPLAWTRHVPVILFAAGLPLAVLALADPYTSLVAENVTYPGRRIALMIDASDSMQTSFRAKNLNTRNEVQPAFFTTVAAAQRFVELRRKGKFRDLVALIEFGSRAYVITPFTSDYDNLLLSMALIGDPVEFSLFPDSGTVIASALEQSIEIFKAFDFLEASGNLMVIFTDGEDTTSIVHGRSLDDILKSAVDNHIPLYFVRTNYDKEFGEGIPDAQWREAVEKTGGRYYVAKDEASLLAAVNDIDREAVGTIAARQYTSQQPRFTLFALLAALLWSTAAALKVLTPYFSRMP
ncbi:MAG TPA: VWA domain-containing protein [Vicinamibacterales bacterium]|nr:VWA domain-containing protein [Vicinamibacterales bacterium]